MKPVSHEQLSAYVDGALSAAEKAQVDRALAESPELRTDLARLRALGPLIKSVPAQEPPADFYARVLNKTRIRPRRWAPWSVSLVTAMAAALVMIYVFQDSKPSFFLSKSRREMSQLEGATPAMMADRSIAPSAFRENKQEKPSADSAVPLSLSADPIRKDKKKTASDEKNSLASPGAAGTIRRSIESGENISLSSAKGVGNATPPVPSKQFVFEEEFGSTANAIRMEPRQTRLKETNETISTKRGPAPPLPEWQGDSSGVTDAREIIIRSVKEWDAFWVEHQSIHYPPAPVPPVDFNAQMVVGVFAGDKGSSGYSVEVTKVSSTAVETLVEYHLSTPDIQSDKSFLAVMTQPHHLKVVPRSDRPVRFVER
ncbi:MAG: zf-HC2 domain-containing protein [Elusimicrobia bacterium]|nr:zf-HC2 domain-containing protein [Elusimicrobiota bacterium]MBP9127234.1 zf-HC2 domain-containing protein [Elusimicrobiota bacterium]MBP9699178.1 zf-HC2 domain-containing protein [Elusimicrobiota bacterium]